MEFPKLILLAGTTRGFRGLFSASVHGQGEILVSECDPIAIVRLELLHVGCHFLAIGAFIVGKFDQRHLCGLRPEHLSIGHIDLRARRSQVDGDRGLGAQLLDIGGSDFVGS